METSPLETGNTLSDIVDSYSGAPVRSALKSMQDTGKFKDMVNSYANQFGQDNKEAPTAEQLVANDSITNKYRDTLLPTAVQVGTDPLSYLPLLGELKGSKVPETLSNIASSDRIFRNKINPDLSNLQNDVSPLRSQMNIENKLKNMFQDLKPEEIPENEKHLFENVSPESKTNLNISPISEKDREEINPKLFKLQKLLTN